MQTKCSFQHLSVQYEFGFGNENILHVKVGYFKVMTHKLYQNANFKNGGTTIQIGILHVLSNILSVYLLSMIHEMSGYLEIHKIVVMSFYTLKKINKVQVAG